MRPVNWAFGHRIRTLVFVQLNRNLIYFSTGFTFCSPFTVWSYSLLFQVKVVTYCCNPNLDIYLPDHVASYPKGVMFVFTSMTPSDLKNQILLDSQSLYLNYENFMVNSQAVSVAPSKQYPNIGCSCY